MCRWMAIICLLGFGVAGCDLFSTRDAEEPGDTTDLCGPAVSSDQVMSVLDCAFQFHLPENYLELFSAEDYEFIPDGAALSNHQDLLPWGYEEEAAHIRRLFSAQVVPPDSLVWVVFEEEDVLEWGDSASYLENYTLHVGHILEGVPRDAIGRVELTVDRTIDGTWVIRKWRDEAIGLEATWSEIRALIR